MTDDRTPGASGGMPDATGSGGSTPPPPGGGAPPPPAGTGGTPPPSSQGRINTGLIVGGVIVGVIAVIALVVALVNAGGDDDTAAGTTTTAGETTTTAETTTTSGETTTTSGETTTTAGETTTTAAETTTSAAAGGLGGECAIDQLNLIEPGVLTVATGEPAFPPWVGDGSDETFDVPESKTGFEAALVYDLAEILGFADDQVTWVRTQFDEAIAPGPKTFDFNIQQYSITDVRDEVVDFSDPYYVTKQSLVALAGSPLIGATTLADLADARLGAAIGTTSLDFIENVIQPTEPASVYDENLDAILALVAGQIDGIVVDLPTAYFINAVQIPEQGQEGVIVAQFETPAQEPDEYGMLFADGNPLVDCVNQALAVLRDDGTLQDLEDQWLAQGGDIPTISE